VEFDADSTLELTPALVRVTETRNSGITGDSIDLNLVHTGDVRPSQVIYELTSHLVLSKWRGPDGEPQLNLFGQLECIVRQRLDGHLVCRGGTYSANMAAEPLPNSLRSTSSRPTSRPRSKPRSPRWSSAS
jgi:type III restriction enzyme